MRLLSLEIGEFKSLRDFKIDFGAGSNTTLLGKNGTGKSHLLEALITIFLELESGSSPSFRYNMKYECRKNIIYIDAEPRRDKDEKIRVDIENISGNTQRMTYQDLYTDYDNEYPRFLPKHIFSYYSGFSSRMADLFVTYREGIYREVLRGTEKLSHAFFYAYPAYGALALLAFFLEEDKKLQLFLDRELGIQGIESTLFVMHQPAWSSREGDPRFWNTRGVINQLIENMYKVSFAPMFLKAPSIPNAAIKQQENLYLYIRNEPNLRKLVASYSNPQEFFKALESAYISKILGEIRVRFRKNNASSSLAFQDLSEGEQQLLIVLGLLRFTKDEEVLFLLDEPDTHLNPAWSVQYLKLIQEMVGNPQTSHVIMATHNPLVISSLERENVRIMQRYTSTTGDDELHELVRADLPTEDPQGMGVAAILTSDLFGLRTTLDAPTQQKLDRRRDLAFREANSLSEEDLQELNELNFILSNLDFSITARDPLYYSFAREYREFVREFTRRATPDLKEGVVFTPEQQQRQRELTRQILREIKAQRGQEL